MNRKHFIATAKIVQKITDERVRRSVAEDFAALFAGENPRFQSEKFLDACEPVR